MAYLKGHKGHKIHIKFEKTIGIYIIVKNKCIWHFKFIILKTLKRHFIKKHYVICARVVIIPFSFEDIKADTL